MGGVIKAAMPDYIAQEIALKVQYSNIMRDDTCPLNCATHLEKTSF